MSVKNREEPFSFQGYPFSFEEHFVGIKELGFSEHGSFIVNAWTTEPDSKGRRGSYFTGIAISPVAYRREHKSLTGFKRTCNQYLIVYDDYRHEYGITASAEVINALVAECIAHEIPEAKQ